MRATNHQGSEFDLLRISCPTCGPSTTRVVGKRGGEYQRWNLGIATDIVECASCTLLFPDPFPFPRDVAGLYGAPTEYFAAHDLMTKVAHYRDLARELRAACSVARPRVLDVGAGRGDFLFAARLEGFEDCVGIEPSPAIARFGSDFLGVSLEVTTAEGYAGAHPEAKFDVIVLLGVLEHVHDPDLLLRTIRQLAAPGAILFVDVPRDPNLVTMVGNAFNRLRGDAAVFNLQPTWAPYHVFGFNPRALDVLLRKHGFEIESIRTHASPTVRSSSSLADRVQSMVATQVARVANVVGLAANMNVLARSRVEAAAQAQATARH